MKGTRWKCVLAGMAWLAVGFGKGGAFAAEMGALRGRAMLEATGDPLRGASVLIVQLGRSTTSGDDGSYLFESVPPGTYEVLAHLHPLADLRRTVEIPPGQTVVLDLQLKIAPVHEEITVTATGVEQTTLDVIPSVATLELADLIPKAATSLGDVLDHQSGVAKRSYGPGSSRPIIRGFDGDRVLILQDGMPSGTLSSQSGDGTSPSSTNQRKVVPSTAAPPTPRVKATTT